MKYIIAGALIAGIIIFAVIIGAVIRAPPDWTKYHINDNEEDKDDGSDRYDL